MALLEVSNLGVSFDTDLGEVRAVRDVSFSVNQGEIFGIVGESGSGKSVSTRAILRINPANARITGGSVKFDGKEILSLSEKEFMPYRGRRIAMIFQDSLTALNPVYTIGSKMSDLICQIEGTSRRDAAQKTLSLLAEVGIRDPERCFRSYPHELSGGMRQRVMIAMAVACSPDLIIADEPTTSLDVTIQAQILRLLRDIQRRRGCSVILITHDLGGVAQMCRRISVMCGGYVVETGTAEQIFHHPVHPYTQALIASMPRADREFRPFLEHSVSRDRGRSAVGEKEDALCPFLDRCPAASAACRGTLPRVRAVEEEHTARCFADGKKED